MHCLDSDFLIEVARRSPGAQALLVALEKDGRPVVSAISVFEVTNTARDGDRALLLEFVDTFDVAPVDGSVAIAASKVSQSLLRRGLALPPPDVLIAATCLLHGLTLVTRNKRHFGRVPGLRIHTW